MFRLMLVALVVFGCVSAAAAERWVGTQMARVDIDASGQVTATQLLDSTLGTAMQQTLVERISRVEFEPATLNGVVAPAQATVLVSLLVQADRDGMRLVIDGVELIAGYRNATPPRYPSKELRRGATAEVMIRVDYDGDGRPVNVTPADPAKRKDRFMRAALAAAKNWELEPERVAGIGVSGTAMIPVRFTIEGVAPAGGSSPSGKLKFPDGGSLQLFQVAEPEWKLAQSQLRVRSIASAQKAIDGGS